MFRRRALIHDIGARKLLLGAGPYLEACSVNGNGLDDDYWSFNTKIVGG